MFFILWYKEGLDKLKLTNLSICTKLNTRKMQNMDPFKFLNCECFEPCFLVDVNKSYHRINDYAQHIT